MKTTLTISLVCLYTFFTQAQQLQVDGGPILLPRLTAAERDQITALDGMLIYNTDVGKTQVYSPLHTSFGTTPINPGTCLDSVFQPFTPTSDLVLLSVEFHDFTAGRTGSVKIFTGDPCANTTVVAATTSITSEVGWNKYTFTSPVPLQSGTTYFFGSDAGDVCSDYSNLGDDADDPLFGRIAETTQLDCQPIINLNFAIRVNGYGASYWQDLH